MFTENFYTELVFANGALKPPAAWANVKAQPLDFQVDEIMNIEFADEGEHLWLQVSKSETHSDQITKSLAKIAGIHAKNVGVSGMKDFKASTTQWFSVWLPGVKDQDLPNWSELESAQVSIDQVKRHQRKLKRGTHVGNRFKIVLRDVEGDKEVLEQRLQTIKTQGVPSYFGEQRFGRGGSNLQQAFAMLESGRKIKQRQKRSMLLSSARSWLFNLVLSERLKVGTWLEPSLGEPLNLSGSRQFFINEDMQDAVERIQQLDVHTTAPLWGEGAEQVMQAAIELHQFEQKVIGQNAELVMLKNGLEKERLSYGRRAMRFVPENFDWQILKLNKDQYDLELNFMLGRGQFATSLLRELVQARHHEQI